LAEEKGTQACARDVDGGCDADLRGGEFYAAAGFGESFCDIADHRDFEAVEHPDPAQSEHDPPVEARPGQAIQPTRHLRREGIGPNVPVHRCLLSFRRGVPVLRQVTRDGQVSGYWLLPW
jgi:hypothetical protein